MLAVSALASDGVIAPGNSRWLRYVTLPWPPMWGRFQERRAAWSMRIGQVESRYRLTTILAMGCTRRGVLCARCDHLLNWFRTRYTFSWIPRASFGQRMEMYFHNLQLLRCGTTMRIF